MDTTSRIINLLSPSQKQEILEKAIKDLQEQICTTISNLSTDKLILVHDYLTVLVDDEVIKVRTVIKSRPTKDLIIEPASPSTREPSSKLIFTGNLYVPCTAKVKTPQNSV